MKALVGILAVVMLGAPSPPSQKDPELKLTGSRFVFLPWADPRGPRPSVTVRITAELVGEPEDPEEYYCLDEEWEWDDESNPSLHEVDCDPYEPGMELTRRFSGSRAYRYPGTYNITLRLKNGRKTIVYGQTQVSISER